LYPTIQVFSEVYLEANGQNPLVDMEPPSDPNTQEDFDPLLIHPPCESGMQEQIIQQLVKKKKIIFSKKIFQACFKWQSY